jgi:exopolysaccharide biosynthesis polyprenyl glycosylphosphotransferase
VTLLARSSSFGTTIRDLTAVPAAPYATPAAPRVGAISLHTLARKGLQVGADVVAVALGLLVAFRLRKLFPEPLDVSPVVHLRMAAATLVFWPLVFARYRLYNARSIGNRVEEFGRVAHGVLVMCLLQVVAAYMFRQSVSRAWLIAAFPVVLAFVSLDREITRLYFKRLRTTGKMLRPVIVVGGNAEAEAIVSMLQSQPSLGYQVLGITADDALPGALVPGGPQVLGPIDETVNVVAATGATTAIIATTGVDQATANQLARRLQDHGIHVELSSGLRDIAAERLTVRALGRHPVFYLEPTVRSGWRALAKREFDLAASLFALLVLSPLLLTVAALVKLTSKGPVFFVQERVGRNGDVFRVYKFRTMVNNAEDLLSSLQDCNEIDGPLFKMKHDPRITPIGRLLRKFSIDELPQLWNVVRNDMSLVGPRPALVSEVAQWGPEVNQRLRVRPGITGMWQVSGRSNSTFDDYVRLDLYYVDNWTLLTDLTIVAKTIPAVLFSKGAY